MTGHEKAAFLAERNYRIARDRILDDATVALLRVSSPSAVLALVDHEQRAGIPAYDSVDAVEYDPRATVVRCLFCGRRIVQYVQERLYCGDACRSCARYHRLHPEARRTKEAVA